MFFSKHREGKSKKNIISYLKNKSFQRFTIAVLTLIFALIIIYNGTAPQKYNFKIMDKSQYDIDAPWDVEDKAKTEENANLASSEIPPVMTEIVSASIDIINANDDFFTILQNERKGINDSLQSQGISSISNNYLQRLEVEQAIAISSFYKKIKQIHIDLTLEQVKYLITKATDDEISKFKSSIKELLRDVLLGDITSENLANKSDEIHNKLKIQNFSQEIKNIGYLLVNAILKENKEIDLYATKVKREKTYQDALISKKAIIKKDTRIINKGDTVTKEKYLLLSSLNLLQKSGIDYSLAAGILIVFLLLSALLILYMNHFSKNILYKRSDVILLCVIILITLLIGRVMYGYSAYAIPITIAAMLISILLDLKLAVMVNLILTIALSFITKGDINFVYMSLISGTFSAFIVSKANQRNKLFIAGFMIAAINILVILSLEMVNKGEFLSIIGDLLVVALNGILSVILTIGSLPFWESVFNVVTPLKLLELSNPNQPLIKRLLMEAPGTYHHSLMVGNLAEMATETIGGNALLARVGAYFHDIGKLKRPNFFKENQMSDNPHDRMTANLSTLVITSHTQDGVELAIKHKIPLAIQEIIKQHHGSTLVAYFYHKAINGEKGEEVTPENFRYDGPRPTSKEAAVVMLADSVEAAVRSMVDKTEGKVEGLVRKIIKDKLDDGQLDLCSLTLKDLDDIAKSFIKVLSGFFHEREEYPDIKVKKVESDEQHVLKEISKLPKSFSDNKD